jgi:hypothetical protein
VAKGYLVGHILTDHIRHTEVNSIHACNASPENEHLTG